ncbi:MAG: hypothetical protein AB7N76_19115 [Planctomycetota bacterium]
MKRTMGICLLAASMVFSGCELFDKKKDDDKGGTEQPKGGGGGGGGAPAMDLSTMIQVPGYMMLGEGAAVGQKVALTSKGQGYSNSYMVAIVGEDGDNWKVESTMMTAAYGEQGKDQLVGMVVDKKTGKVSKAVVGKKGEKGKDVKITPMDPPKKGEAAEGEDTEVKLAMGGPYPAKLYTQDIPNVGKVKTWSGTDGELKGVMLKTESPNSKCELKEMPKKGSADVGGSKVEFTTLVYDDGHETSTSDHPAIKAINYGMFKNKQAGNTTEVTAVASDAKPELKWD